jgi:hypothetical protein
VQQIKMKYDWGLGYDIELTYLKRKSETDGDAF